MPSAGGWNGPGSTATSDSAEDLAAATEQVLAHYGGAPEALTAVLPVAIVIAFIVLERRARRREREAAEQAAVEPEQQDDTAAESGS